MKEIEQTKAVLTIGTGKKIFVDLAVNLARSFLYWHPGNEIIFQLVTDQPELIPPDLIDKVQLITIKPGELGVGFSTKLHLDKLVTCRQTLFIDSDCLIFEPLGHLFNRFAGHQVSVVGDYIADGEWFGDIAAICKQFNLPHIPKFNGGLYYLEKGSIATEVYSQARELEKQYDEIGFVRLRNRPNDEVLMALAMQLHQQTPLIDDGTIMSDPQACPGGYKIDVIKGKRWMLNPPHPHPLHVTWYPFEKVTPAIVHFLGSYTQNYPYKREVYRLQKAEAKQLNFFSEAAAFFFIQFPEQTKNFFKGIFRPVYHMLFGYRKIKQSERVV
ncbi:hypothetical protein HDF24_01605 [Mucilaginibacter sp. X4EP1]|uniref:hypothetical protein n=1 Tax=Mucilaginibacter sp. X4EP1 TaxID=2723092 RepID=UPI00216A6148|nr:hypothetical protein [Mucilaginibacter sp. X4EP1]MCS3811709.1 hypothetical protein [Mucilaginibacter sp. X4EP1]